MTEFPYPFEPKQLAINGHTLSYIDEGKGPTVVMLHGNPTWSFYYRNLANALKKNFRVIVPDHMGCGYSDKPQDYSYTLNTHIDNLERLLVHLDPGPFSLIVHDWGGAIGFGYAGRFPDQIKSLIVQNTAAFRSHRIPLRIKICRTPFLGSLLVRGLNGFAGPAVTMAVSRKLPPEVRCGYLAPYGNWHDRVAIYRFVKDIPLVADHPSWPTLIEVEQNLARLQDKPMLILWGGKDFCFTKHFYDEWRYRFPRAQTKFFPDAGHYVLEDAYDEIEELVHNFLVP